MRYVFSLSIAIFGLVATSVSATRELSRQKRAGSDEIPDINDLLAIENSLANIDCRHNGASISISAAYLASEGIDADRLVLTDADGFTECEARNQDGQFIFMLGLGQCVWGTENKDDGVAHYYKACVISTPTPGDNPISRADIPTLVMGCLYDREYKTVVGPIEPRLVRFDKVVHPVKFRFEADLLRYTDDNFDVLATDTDIELGTELFFKSQMTPSSGFILQGRKCWVQPGDESYEGPARFYILKDGCAEEDPLSRADPGNVVHTSHTDSKLEFSYQFFTWRHQELSDQDFWVCCELDVCPENEECDDRECDGGSRTKRSVAAKSESMKTVSMGPLRLAKRKAPKASNKKTHKGNKNQKTHQKPLERPKKNDHPVKKEKPLKGDNAVKIQLMALQQAKENIHTAMVALGGVAVILIIASGFGFVLISRRKKYLKASKI